MPKPFSFLVLFAFLIQACAPLANPTVAASNPVSDPFVAESTPSAVPLALVVPSTPTAGLAQTISTPASVSIPTNPDFWKTLPVVPASVSDRVREIYQIGLAMGNNPHAFSKVGDCHSTNPFFLADFDLGPNVYHLGEHANLQETITYFQGSWGRTSLAAKKGLSTAGVLAPLWADWKQCSNNESPLDCEIRKNHPSFVIISLGTNEALEVKKDPSTFEGRLRRVIEHVIDQGVVPILSTKADNDEGDHFINYTTARLALEYQLPLWNFWLAVQDIPQQGMRNSNHLTFAPSNSYTDFSNLDNLQYGMQMRNLTALEVLDFVRRETVKPVGVLASTPTPVFTATPAVAYQPGLPLTSEVDGMVSLYIPAGTFEMGMTSGNPDAAPVHTVRLNDYWFDSTEVTNAMFANFLTAQGNQQDGGTDWLNPNEALVQVFEKDGTWQVKAGFEDHPIVGVSWFGAKAYCEWVGRRLPTEAEWEYAARGADSRRFPWGNDDLSCALARYGGCGKGAVAVGGFPEGASPFGVLDMAGNVAEWVNDRYGDDYYQNSPVDNPQGPLRGYYRVVRGGFWDSTYIQLRAMHRGWAGADTRDSSIGFRCAFSP